MILSARSRFAGLSWQPAAAHLHRPGQRSGMDEKINPNPEVFKAVRLVREDDGGVEKSGQFWQHY